ncbi:putative phage tail protein [Tissierella praeacuta]|uniref:putative phage tail protein n=1 Tax=Tissierella praeacuta TaxID=43131 RepID=UPI0033411814
MSRLLEYLPSYERSSIVFQEILNAEQIEFNKLGLNMEDLERQFFIDTATWGLAIYEKELNLPIRPNKSLEERKSIIKAKMRGVGKVSLAMIKAIVEAFTNVSVDVDFDRRIQIAFTNQEKIKFSKEMSNAINEVKPAHLGYDYIVNYIEELLLILKTCEFPNELRITDEFHTEDNLAGYIEKSPFNIASKTYEFPVCLGIADIMTTETLKLDSQLAYLINKSHTPYNEITFKRTGDIAIGEGEI